MIKKYKQFIFGIIVGALLFGGISALAGNQTIEAVLSDITVKLDGQALQLDNPPIIYQDRTYLPVRKVAEAVGKQVAFDEVSNTVIIGDETTAVNKADYISLKEAGQQCVKINANYDLTITSYSPKIVTLRYIDKYDSSNNKIIFDDIPFIYIDSQECISLKFFNEKILPLLK